MRLIFVSLLSTIVLCQYVPEPYGWACYRMATKRAWPECASAGRSKQRECLCGLPEFVEMTEMCLSTAVANSSDPVAAANTARSLSLCPLVIPKDPKPLNSTTSVKNIVGIPVESLEEYKYIDPISEFEINMAIKTAEWRITNDYRAERAGASLVGFWGAIIILRYIGHILGSFLSHRWLTSIALWRPVRLFRACVLNSPLGSHHHSEPRLKKLGIRLPTRPISIAIVLFAALNYALIFTNFPYCSSNFIYTSKSQQWNKSLAIRCAFVIMWKLPLVFCFAGRNNVFLLLGHPWSLDTFNTFHKWIARITVVDIIIHAIAISLVKAEQNLYGFVWKVEYWIWGVVGCVVASVIAIQSMYWLSKSRYELFKVVHIVLAVTLVIATWFHVKVLPYGMKHVYAIIAIWSFDHACRIVRLFLASGVTAHLEHVNEEIILLTMDTPKAYKLVPRVQSTFLFLHLPPYYMFWQSHPFTLMRQQVPVSAETSDSSFEKGTSVSKSTVCDSYLTSSHSNSLACTVNRAQSAGTGTQDLSISKDALSGIAGSLGIPLDSIPSLNTPHLLSNDRLAIAIKRQNGITRRLAKLQDGPIKVAIDGPYGNFFPLHRFKQVIFIVGGIGITSSLRYIQYLAERRSTNTINLRVFWAIKNVEHIPWVLKYMEDTKQKIQIDIFIDQSSQVDRDYILTESVTNVRLNYARLSCMNVMKSEIEHLNSKNSRQLSTAIFACGPAKLNDDARESASWAIRNGNSFVDYFEESFCW